jgi:hypothetical protein
VRDLIEALQILLKYGDSKWPTSCVQDILGVTCVDPSIVSVGDIKRLNELGFRISKTGEYFVSFRFGNSWEQKK